MFVIIYYIIEVRFFAIYPPTEIVSDTDSLFVFSYVNTGTLCNRPMGLQNNRLKNHLMTSSSRWDNFHGPYRARLNIRRHGRYIGAWSSQYNNRYQWLQVDFTRPAKIIRISTQGRQDTNQWVTQYYVTHSLDAVNFVPYQERNSRKVSAAVETLTVCCCSWTRTLLSRARLSQTE